MASEKITAMPDLAGAQVPTDLMTAVDLSAVPASQNVKSTLNDLFATITKNITDRAVRFQAPGTAPAVSAASEGSIYHNGSAFLASSNAGAYEQVYTLSAQTAAQVFAGPTTGGPAVPTFRSLALTDLPTQTGTGNIVLATNPVMTNPTIDIGITGVSSGRLLGFQPVASGVNYVDVYNAISSAGPTLHAAGTATNIALNLHAKGSGVIACVGNALRITGSSAGSNGIIQARGGTSSGGVLQLYELTGNGTNYVALRSPDNLAANVDYELPATDGTPGQGLVTDGFGVLSFASIGGTGSTGFKNLIINGDFRIDQRQNGSVYDSTGGLNNNRAYTLDRFFIQSQGASSTTFGNDVIDVQRSTTSPPSGRQYSLALDVETANRKFGVVQIVENTNCIQLASVNSVVSLSFKARVSSTTRLNDIRAAVIGWTGSVDDLLTTNSGNIVAVTGNGWENSSNNPVLFSGYTYQNTPANLNVTTSWATYTIPNITITTSGVNNLLVFIWSNATSTNTGSADILYLSDIQLEAGTTSTDFDYLDVTDSLQMCQRYLPQYRASGLAVNEFLGLGFINGAGTPGPPPTLASAFLFLPLFVTPRTFNTSMTIETNLGSNELRFAGVVNNSAPAAVSIDATITNGSVLSNAAIALQCKLPSTVTTAEPVYVFLNSFGEAGARDLFIRVNGIEL